MMEFQGYRLCVALLLLLSACYHVSSQPADTVSQHTDPASQPTVQSSQSKDQSNQPTNDTHKMVDMIYRQLRDTCAGTIITEIKTLIKLQIQHSRDVTKANSDLQSQYTSSMAVITKTLATINSQMISLAQQQNETRAAMNSQMISLAQQQNETQAAMNSQISSPPQQQHQTPKAASEACAGNITGPTTMLVDSQPITATCDGKGWIVIQRRVDGAYDFPNRSWEDYKLGFGDLAGSFWLGLEQMHRLTNHQAVLRVELEDWEGDAAWAQYSSFQLEGESGKYKLHVSNYSGTAGDGLLESDGAMFTTRDQDNDGYSSGNCAEICGGAGWWFNQCASSSLNGKYVPGGASDHPWIGIHWKGYECSFKKAQMKVFITP